MNSLMYSPSLADVVEQIEVWIDHNTNLAPEHGEALYAFRAAEAVFTLLPYPSPHWGSLSRCVGLLHTLTQEMERDNGRLYSAAEMVHWFQSWDHADPYARDWVQAVLARQVPALRRIPRRGPYSILGVYRSLGEAHDPMDVEHYLRLYVHVGETLRKHTLDHILPSMLGPPDDVLDEVTPLKEQRALVRMRILPTGKIVRYGVSGRYPPRIKPRDIRTLVPVVHEHDGTYNQFVDPDQQECCDITG